MAPLKAGDSFPEGVSFSYVPSTPEDNDIRQCSIPITYDASTEFKNKKVVLVAVPGAFTPTCQEQHLISYLENVDKLKAKGVDHVIFIASNDAFVMNAWRKANGVADDFIIFASDGELVFSQEFAWTIGSRTARYAIIIDHGKVTYADKDVPKSIAASGAEGVLAKL